MGYGKTIQKHAEPAMKLPYCLNVLHLVSCKHHAFYPSLDALQCISSSAMQLTADSPLRKNTTLHIVPNEGWTWKLRKIQNHRQADLQQVHFLVGVRGGILAVGSHPVTGLQALGKADL